MEKRFQTENSVGDIQLVTLALCMCFGFNVVVDEYR